MRPDDVTRIMLIDDDELQLEMTAIQLRNAGFSSITIFQDSSAALQQINSSNEPVSLILLDLNMPGMDGLEFLKRIKDTCFSGSILLISGEDARILEAAVRLATVYDLNVIGHLNKPIEQVELDAVLGAWSFVPKTVRKKAARQSFSAERIREGLGNGEFFNVYQPKVCLRTKELRSVEALARWQHPVAGVVFPDQFISVAEENGLIDALAESVLGNALTQLNLWREQGLQLSMAVNISMENLVTQSFLRFVESKLNETGVDPHQLTLEITESTLMKDYALVLDMLTRLRMRHVKLSIDDFGTGHSSNVQLRDIPFTELKIDRGFVNGAWKNTTQEGIVKANLQLAKNLSIITVAEGVEDLNDWNFLIDANCDFAQGYFISRPMAGEKLADWNAEWKARAASL
ncbi:MAG: EAL domain-containing response regulator [Pseudohongiellaceae bacterium]